MPTNPATSDHASGGPQPPVFYHHRGVARRLVPDTWGSFHAWVFVIFLVATFGPMFHGWATSIRLVGGWPISMGWIMAWMILQTINLIAFYFTTVRPTFGRIALETGVAEETTAADDAAGASGSLREQS